MSKKRDNNGFKELDEKSVENVSGGYVKWSGGSVTYSSDGTANTFEQPRYDVYTDKGQHRYSIDDDGSFAAYEKAMTWDKIANGYK